MTEIGVSGGLQVILQEGLSVFFTHGSLRLLVLGAYNPPHAHRTLETDLDVGLLLLWNVIFYENADQKSTVSTLNPVSGLKVIQNKDLKKSPRRSRPN
jgi:uncharacterized protein (DUF302 family)